MRLIILLFLAGLLTACGGGQADAPLHTASAATGMPQHVVALGDSITHRTGLCPQGEAMAECLERQHLDTAISYASHLANASGGALLLADNQGRGGDTCTAQPAWLTGPHAGQPRGLLARVPGVLAARPDTVLLLAGINDVMVWGVPVEQAVACVDQVRTQLQRERIRVVLLTYPPITRDTPVFASAPDRLARHAALNAGLQAIGAVAPAYWPAWAAPHLTTDGTHTSAAGAVWMATAVAAEVAR